MVVCALTTNPHRAKSQGTCSLGHHDDALAAHRSPDPTSDRLLPHERPERDGEHRFEVEQQRRDRARRARETHRQRDGGQESSRKAHGDDARKPFAAKAGLRRPRVRNGREPGRPGVQQARDREGAGALSETLDERSRQPEGGRSSDRVQDAARDRSHKGCPADMLITRTSRKPAKKLPLVNVVSGASCASTSSSSVAR